MSAIKACIAVLVMSLAGLRFWGSGIGQDFRLSVTPAQIRADGRERAEVSISGTAAPQISILPKHSGTTVGPLMQKADGSWVASIRAGVAPGTLTIHATADGAGAAETTLQVTPYLEDREMDGMPDALRLDQDGDRAAFRRWFTFLAEAQYYQREKSLPAEINDCAALIRYAYREALREHDSAWAAAAKLPLLLAMDSVGKYQYPYTLLRASLFRVKPGAFQAADLDNGAFAQFADAKTLQSLNTHFVSRDLGRAEPGDLLFFRHESADMPFHTMIYLGKSQVQDDGQRYLLYHTGPDGSDPGEIRRPTLQELSSHPNPSWRPVTGNPTFLGVYRWNILR
ncbi:MAG: DUF1175 family protein [Bryobacteraceae bacterium]